MATSRPAPASYCQWVPVSSAAMKVCASMLAGRLTPCHHLMVDQRDVEPDRTGGFRLSGEMVVRAARSERVGRNQQDHADAA